MSATLPINYNKGRVDTIPPRPSYKKKRDEKKEEREGGERIAPARRRGTKRIYVPIGGGVSVEYVVWVSLTRRHSHKKYFA